MFGALTRAGFRMKGVVVRCQFPAPLKNFQARSSAYDKRNRGLRPSCVNPNENPRPKLSGNAYHVMVK